MPIKTWLTFVLASGLAASGFAQEANRAYIPRKIPDGTAPPPAPAKPRWVVPEADVLSQKSYDQGGRTITVRQIKPIPLPPPPTPAEPAAPVEMTEEFRERIAEYRRQHPRQKTIALGATIYRLEDGTTRSLVRVSQGEGNADPVRFWSSGDFSMLAGIGAFTDNQGETRPMFMSWSIHDTSRLTKRVGATGRESKLPVIPEIPSNNAAYVIQEGIPDADLRTVIDSLHEILNHDGDALRRAAEGRARAARAREEFLKANPPQPQDITVNYWLIEKPVAREKGVQP